MKKLFIDADIIIDLLAKRPDYLPAAELFTLLARKEIAGFTSPLVLANVHYIVTKYAGKEKSIASVRKIRKYLSVLAIDAAAVDSALSSAFSDFEDALQYYSAVKHEIDLIITRNKKDYRHGKARVMDAGEFMDLYVGGNGK